MNAPSDQSATAAYARVKHENIALRDRNERLRTALEQIADVPRTLVHAQAIAGDALASDEEGTP